MKKTIKNRKTRERTRMSGRAVIERRTWYDSIYPPTFGGGAGRLIKIGNQPIDLKGQVFWNAEKPKGTSDLVFQFQVKFLFPK